MSTATKPKHQPKAQPIRYPSPDHRVILARRLDMLAGCELQHGHHAAAERLAHRAAEMRGAA